MTREEYADYHVNEEWPYWTWSDAAKQCKKDFLAGYDVSQEEIQRLQTEIENRDKAIANLKRTMYDLSIVKQVVRKFVANIKRKQVPVSGGYAIDVVDIEEELRLFHHYVKNKPKDVGPQVREISFQDYRQSE
jgi:uncharacterized protein YaaR (DUF327 family)